jgi:glycosyltransferase involved in cell wall biosynthesis
MTQPLVSVLMTVYNREKYIATAIESVLAQSMADFELIVVDDSSTDRSVEIACQYQSDSRVKVFINETNLGDFPNRNRVAAHATGKYLKYVDSDDAIYPHCLEVMTHMMERHPLAGMLLCAWEETDSPYPFELSPLEAYRRCFVDGLRMSNAPATTMYRRNAFEQVEGFSTRWSLSADWELTLKMARHFPVVFAPTGLVFYRVHKGQIVAYMEDSYLQHFYQASAIALDALRHPDCPLTRPERRWALSKVLKGAIMYAGSLALKRGRPKAAARYLASLDTKPSEWWSVCYARKPRVPRPSHQELPEWSEFPRTNTSGLGAMKRSIPRVSVIVPALRYGPELRRTFQSLCRQSLQAYELLVCARGSTDRSRLMQELGAAGRELRVIAVPEEAGELEAINLAANQARAPLIKIVSPGDFLYPWALEHLVVPMERLSDVPLQLESPVGSWVYPVVLTPGQTYGIHFLNRPFLNVPASAATVRRGTFLDHGGFDTALGGHATLDLWLKMAARSNTLLSLPWLTNACVPWFEPEIPESLYGDLTSVSIAKKALSENHSPLTGAERESALAAVDGLFRNPVELSAFETEEVYRFRPELHAWHHQTLSLLREREEASFLAPDRDKTVATGNWSPSDIHNPTALQ